MTDDKLITDLIAALGLTVTVEDVKAQLATAKLHIERDDDIEASLSTIRSAATSDLTPDAAYLIEHGMPYAEVMEMPPGKQSAAALVRVRVTPTTP